MCITSSESVHFYRSSGALLCWWRCILVGPRRVVFEGRTLCSMGDWSSGQRRPITSLLGLTIRSLPKLKAPMNLYGKQILIGFSGSQSQAIRIPDDPQIPYRLIVVEFQKSAAIRTTPWPLPSGYPWRPRFRAHRLPLLLSNDAVSEPCAHSTVEAVPEFPCLRLTLKTPS